MLGRNFSRQHFESIFIFPRKYDLTFHADISCRLSPIHEMSVPIFFEVKNKTNIMYLSFAESTCYTGRFSAYLLHW